MRVAELALVLLAASCAAACTRSAVAVQAPVLYPARVPVRAFPSILIAGESRAGVDFAERLRAHLAKDGTRDVRRIALAELEPLREAGSISPLTVVVTIEPSLSADARTSWDYVPVDYCTLLGCYSDFQPIAVSERQVTGELVLTVYEGPTARVLQTEQFRVQTASAKSREVQKRVAEQLAWELERAVDVLQTARTFALEAVDEPPAAREGIAAIREGDWARGRALLEQAARALGGESRRVQARVWYDLEIARWLAPGAAGLTRAAYEDARRALELAIACDGSGRYLQALERLGQARARQAVLEQQRRATQHNFALRAAMPAAR